MQDESHESSPGSDAVRKAVVTAARRYFEARRARIPDFARSTFSAGAALRLHRRAIGWDLARAPANIALAPVHVAARAAGGLANATGMKSAARWLRTRRVLMETAVAREVRRRVMVELLELPWEDAGGVSPGDALAEAILAAPEVRALFEGALGAEVGADRRKISAEIERSLAEYAGVRSAVADMTTAATTLGVGAVMFHKATPGMLTLGPAVAAAYAHSAAVAAFPLGATAGSVWYAVFPVAASPALIVGATTGLVAAAAVLATFAGVLADPLQRALGIHQRRLGHLIDVLERQFVEGEAAGFAAREHYVARILDLLDIAVGAARTLRP